MPIASKERNTPDCAQTRPEDGTLVGRQRGSTEQWGLHAHLAREKEERSKSLLGGTADGGGGLRGIGNQGLAGLTILLAAVQVGEAGGVSSSSQGVGP